MIFKIKEAAAYLKVSENHFRNHLRKVIPSVRVGGTLRRWRQQDIDAWLDAQTRVDGHFASTRRGYGTSASRTKVIDTISPRAVEIRRRLERRLSESTQKSLAEVQKSGLSHVG